MQLFGVEGAQFHRGGNHCKEHKAASEAAAAAALSTEGTTVTE